jgi:23S rRNA pseudouridine1911/1915/1917 synthase
LILKAVAGPGQTGKRLDDGAAQLFPQLSKTRLRKIIDWGGCTVDNVKVRVASRTLRGGEEIVIGVIEDENRRELVYSAGDMLHEDSGFLAVNKEAGVNCQRTPYQLKGTVEFAVEMYLKKQGSLEPARIVHRLDRGTSGVMIFPKDRKYAAYLCALLKEGKIEKKYLALATGTPQRYTWEIDAPIAKIAKSRYGVASPGKEAQTLFRVIAEGRGATLLEASPLTGRTHQIRVHLAHCRLPIVGDEVYGGAPAPRMMLHCMSMSFRSAEGRNLAITAPVDETFAAVCGKYGIDPLENKI